MPIRSPNSYSPKAYAKRLADWAAKGFDYSMVEGIRAAMESDKRESIDRAPKKSGALAATIRVTQPTLRGAVRRGVIRASITAGSRAKGSPVIYASVIQLGRVGRSGAPKMAPHTIGGEAGVATAQPGGRFSIGRGRLLSFSIGGRRIALRRVHHPGARLKAHEFIGIDEARAARQIDAAITASGGAL